MTSRALFVLAALVTLALVGRPTPASANPEKVFAGKIITSDKRFPNRAKSPAAFVSAIRKQAKTQFMENRDTKSWRIHFAAFFRKPLNDIEVVVKLYDTANPGSAPVASFEQYISERGERALLAEFLLERKLVGVNRELAMTLEVQGTVVARGTFKILGEAERYTGKVDFSADETDEEE